MGECPLFSKFARHPQKPIKYLIPLKKASIFNKKSLSLASKENNKI